MPFPTILFNSSTGDDSLSSGAGPSVAISGIKGVTFSGQITINVSGDGIDLSSVATDGSAVIWKSNSVGRQFNQITAVNNSSKVITCASLWNITSSGTWAIGGKRRNMDNTTSKAIFINDALAGWTLQTETNQTISGAFTPKTNGVSNSGMITFRGSGEFMTITQSGNANHFKSLAANQPNMWKFENLRFNHSNATKTNAIPFNMNTGTLFFNNCIFGDSGNKITNAFSRAGGNPVIQCTDCDFNYNLGSPVAFSLAGSIIAENCGFRQNVGDVITVVAAGSVYVNNCYFANNMADAIKFGATSTVNNNTVINSVFYQNSGDCIDSSAGVQTNPLIIRNNHFIANSGWALNGAAGQASFQFGVGYNNFGTGTTANKLGSATGYAVSGTDVFKDPNFVNAAALNFESSAVVANSGYPLFSRFIGANQSTTNAFNDIGFQLQHRGQFNNNFAGGFDG